MFPQQPQQQFRTTNANVQLFYRSSTWTKPPGCSQIYMMLIGGGGNNNTSAGGTSGVVTTWWGSAQNVPDSLVVTVSTGNAVDTVVQYRGSNGLNALLTAPAGVLDNTSTAMTANQFAASGFFQSVAGQKSSGTTNASATTFLSGGSTTGNTTTANYGYTSPSSAGYFQLQPIVVGVGGSLTASGVAGIGCGGAGTSGLGGPGLVIIAAW